MTYKTEYRMRLSLSMGSLTEHEKRFLHVLGSGKTGDELLTAARHLHDGFMKSWKLLCLTFRNNCLDVLTNLDTSVRLNMVREENVLTLELEGFTASKPAKIMSAVSLFSHAITEPCTVAILVGNEPNAYPSTLNWEPDARIALRTMSIPADYRKLLESVSWDMSVWNVMSEYHRRTKACDDFNADYHRNKDKEFTPLRYLNDYCKTVPVGEADIAFSHGAYFVMSGAYTYGRVHVDSNNSQDYYLANGPFPGSLRTGKVMPSNLAANKQWWLLSLRDLVVLNGFYPDVYQIQTILNYQATSGDRSINLQHMMDRVMHSTRGTLFFNSGSAAMSAWWLDYFKRYDLELELRK